jgi:Uma2 family endonuclease
MKKLGFGEYWIIDYIDYLALGGTPYIGNPKQPTISIYNLINGEYQVRQFRENETIVSPTFPELTLTVTKFFKLVCKYVTVMPSDQNQDKI